MVSSVGIGYEAPAENFSELLTPLVVSARNNLVAGMKDIAAARTMSIRRTRLDRKNDKPRGNIELKVGKACPLSDRTCSYRDSEHHFVSVSESNSEYRVHLLAMLNEHHHRRCLITNVFGRCS